MSGVSTSSLRKDMLNRTFRGVALGYSTLEFALTRKIPTTNSAVDQLDEPSAQGYARVSVALTTATFMVLNDNEIALSSALYFPTATGSWGAIHGWAAISVEAVPKVKAVGTLNEPIRVVSGVRPFLGAGDVVWGLYD